MPNVKKQSLAKHISMHIYADYKGLHFCATVMLHEHTSFIEIFSTKIKQLNLI